MKPTKRALQKLALGMRREDPKRIWERRAPLTPDAVNELIEEEGVEVLVEPCERRVFPTREYEKVGTRPLLLSSLLSLTAILCRLARR